MLQDDRFDATESITICVMTTDPTEAPLFRVPSAPNKRNGLNTLSRLMVDKITTVPKNKLGHRIGHLDAKDIERVDQAILIFLGWAASGSAKEALRERQIDRRATLSRPDPPPDRVGGVRVAAGISSSLGQVFKRSVVQAARGRTSRAIASPLSMRAFVRSCIACRFIQNSGLVP
jgi:mRNA interferase MazF